VVTSLFAAYFAFSNGFVLAKIWEWFAVPQGMRPLPWPLFAAFMISVGIVLKEFRQPTTTLSQGKKSRETRIGELIAVVSAPWLALLTAWIIK